MRPRKNSQKINKVAAFLLLVLGIIIGGYLVLESQNSQATSLEKIVQEINNQASINDQDHDGLADWEESLYQSNPTNPDTDGDGYLDGEEVVAGYDPTKPAPDDKLNKSATTENNNPQPIRPEPGNLTQILSYILANQLKFDPPLPLTNVQDVGSLEQTLEKTMDEKVVEALQKASASFLTEFIPPFQKEQFEFKTTNDNNLAAIRSYAEQAANKIGALESCQDINNFKDDAEIIQESIETKNFTQANCRANTYLQAYQETLTIPVPLDWLDIHKKFLSVYWTMYKVYQYLPEYEKDPLNAEVLEEMATDLESR